MSTVYAVAVIMIVTCMYTMRYVVVMVTSVSCICSLLAKSYMVMDISCSSYAAVVMVMKLYECLMQLSWK